MEARYVKAHEFEQCDINELCAILQRPDVVLGEMLPKARRRNSSSCGDLRRTPLGDAQANDMAMRGERTVTVQHAGGHNEFDRAIHHALDDVSVRLGYRANKREDVLA